MILDCFLRAVGFCDKVLVLMECADEGQYQSELASCGKAQVSPPYLGAESSLVVVIVMCGCGSSECLILPIGDLVCVGVIFDEALSAER